MSSHTHFTRILRLCLKDKHSVFLLARLAEGTPVWSAAEIKDFPALQAGG